MRSWFFDVAKSGGISDPRNAALIKMFNMVEIGERAGSGIPNIFNVWKKQEWSVPEIEESFEPERITLLLQLAKSSDKKVAIKSSDKKVAIKSSDKKSTIKTALQKAAIIEYITEKVTAKTAEIVDLLGVKEARTRKLLSEMIEEEIIVAEGANRNRVYKLK